MPRARVLVVDDEDLVRTLVLRWLQNWGIEAVGARNALEGLAAMEVAPAEIAIVDLIMPGHDGVWLLQKIHERWPTTVMIVISGAQDEHVILDARKMGAIAFVPKPLERELLRQALDRATQVALGP